MIVLEAMALRVHVISRAVGAIPEVLDSGRVGSLVAGADPREYARVIAARCSSARETAVMVEQAYQRVVTRYSAARTASDYISLYTSLTGSP